VINGHVDTPVAAPASRPLDPQLSPGSDAPGVTIAPGETVDGIRVDPAAPLVPLDPDADRDRYGRMQETHRGIIERFVEPIVPWVILLDPDRGPYVNPGTKARLLQQAFGDVVLTIIIPGSKAGRVAAIAEEAFTATEMAAVREVEAMTAAGVPAEIEAAFRAGGAELRVGERTILVDPGVPASGLTLFGENGFIVGGLAFQTEGELIRTLLHETHRLLTTQSAQGVTAAMAASETSAAASFAERAFSAFFK